MLYFFSQLFGLILMVICVINMRDRKALPEGQSALSRGVISFLLTLGLCLVVTAVLGCIGALRENVKILYVVRMFLRSPCYAPPLGRGLPFLYPLGIKCYYSLMFLILLKGLSVVWFTSVLSLFVMNAFKP